MALWCGSRNISWYSLSAHKGWGAERSAADVAFAEVVVLESKPAAAVMPESKPVVVVVPEKPAASVVMPESKADDVVPASKSASKPEVAFVCAGRPRYRVAVGELTVEVDDDFRPETLQRLLRAVAAC
jgi:hypothetical protein